MTSEPQTAHGTSPRYLDDGLDGLAGCVSLGSLLEPWFHAVFHCVWRRRDFIVFEWKREEFLCFSGVLLGVLQDFEHLLDIIRNKR